MTGNSWEPCTRWFKRSWPTEQETTLRTKEIPGNSQKSWGWTPDFLKGVKGGIWSNSSWHLHYTYIILFHPNITTDEKTGDQKGDMTYTRLLSWVAEQESEITSIWLRKPVLSKTPQSLGESLAKCVCSVKAQLKEWTNTSWRKWQLIWSFWYETVYWEIRSPRTRTRKILFARLRNMAFTMQQWGALSGTDLERSFRGAGQGYQMYLS